MKIREGFVSNSSSTSFICRGIKMELYQVMKHFNDLEEDDIDNYKERLKGLMKKEFTLAKLTGYFVDVNYYDDTWFYVGLGFYDGKPLSEEDMKYLTQKTKFVKLMKKLFPGFEIKTYYGTLEHG